MTVVLAAIVAALLLPLVVTAVRRPAVLRMAGRNLSRRRGETILVVAGSLLGTAIITSSFVVGDIIGASITSIARTQLGPVDVTVTPADSADLEHTVAAIDAAEVEGVTDQLAVTSADAAVEAPVSGELSNVLPRARVVEMDVEVARGFGGDPAITGLADAPAIAADQVLVNQRAADRLEVDEGAAVILHAYGRELDLTVAAVVPEEGLAGYGGVIVAPGTLAELSAGSTVDAAPPRPEVLVSLAGGVFDTRDLTGAAVDGLREAVAAVPNVEVDGVKASLLDSAERDGDSFTELFGAIGSFSVLAGVLLLVNLFVMLAEERKTELGMLRALGFTRSRLTRAFAVEGALYAIAAAAVGTVVGIGIGWVVAWTAGSIFGIADQGMTFRLVVEPASLALGGLIGLGMSLVTIWITSARIARLNVIRAIRDLPEPRQARGRVRKLVLGTLGVIAGAGMAFLGIAEEQAMAILAGVPIAAFSATPLITRLLPERLSRVLTASVALAWGIGAFTLFPDVLAEGSIFVFVVQGVVLVAAAVSLTSSADRVWVRLVDVLAASGRGLTLRLGLAYPLARRARTSMLLGMFSLVIFTMTFIAALSSAFSGQTDDFANQARGGAHILVDSNRANPVTADELVARDDVTVAAGLARGVAEFDAAIVEAPRTWPITGFDADLVELGPPALSSRADGYADDVAVYRAILADPSLVVVSDFFFQEGGPGGERVRAGDTIEVVEPSTGQRRDLTVAGIMAADWVWNGVLASRELTGALFGPYDVVARHYLAVAPDADPDQVAAGLDAGFLANGADASSFTAMVAEGVREQNAFLNLLQGFLGLGLLVGIAGLGVVMVRAVRERRRQVGMLRALGFSTRLVRSAFLAEAGLIAVQGIAIGAVLGLVTARQVLTSSDAFGEASLAFAVPWFGVGLIALVPLAAALAATAWPAQRASQIRPAVALRVAD